MKEIVILAGVSYPEKRFLSTLKNLFPECCIRIVNEGSDGADTRIDEQIWNRKMWKIM